MGMPLQDGFHYRSSGVARGGGGAFAPSHHKSVYRALLWNIETHPEKLFFASMSQRQGMQEF